MFTDDPDRGDLKVQLIDSGKICVYSRLWDTSWFIALTLGVLYLSSSIVRIYWSSFLPSPAVMGDELLYKTNAESFFLFGDFDKLNYFGIQAKLGNFLYQLILSLSFYFGQQFYAVSKAINAILISTAIFPAFLTARCFSHAKLSLLASIMVMVLPGNLFANYIMPENLFFPLFLFTFFLIFRSIYQNGLWNSAGSGLCLALLFLTKPHAIALIIAFLLAIVVIMIYARHFSISIITMGKSLIITIFTMVISYIVVVLLVKNRISFFDLLGDFYSNVGWALVTTPVNMMESFRELFRLTIAHLTAFLFVYSIPAVMIMIRTLQSIKEKDFKPFAFLILGSIAFLAFFAMALKFSSDIRDAEHMMRLHGRYYFFVFPFFLIAFLVLPKQGGPPMLSAAAYIITTACVGVALITVFPSFFPNLPLHADFPDWTWLNSFFRGYRRAIDPQGWTWWDADNLKVVSAIMVGMALLLGLYYAFSKVKSLYPYLLFFLLLGIVANIFELRTQIGLSNIMWRTIKGPLMLIESTIIDRSDPVMLISHDIGWPMHLAFWLSNRNFHVALLAPESDVPDDIIPPDTKWVVLLNRYNLTAPLQLVGSDGLVTIYHSSTAEERQPF
jgi:hypothetical protein